MGDGINMRTLMIDDMRIPKMTKQNMDNIVLATNLDEAFALLDSEPWGFFYLDHDLGGNETIRPFIRHLEKNSGKFKGVICYLISSNPAGLDYMKAALDKAGYLAIILSEQEKSLLFDYRSWEDLTGS